MHPQTHLPVGIVLGAGIALTSPHIPLTQKALIVAAAGFGSILPDIPIAFQALADKYIWKRQPFSAEKGYGAWYTAKDMSHSPLLWIYLMIIPLLFRQDSPHAGIIVDCLVTLGMGVYSHWLIDVFSHCGEEFAETDQSLLYPLNQIMWLWCTIRNELQILEEELVDTARLRVWKPIKLGQLAASQGLGSEYRYNYKVAEGREKHGKMKPLEARLYRVSGLVAILLCFIVFLMPFIIVDAY